MPITVTTGGPSSPPSGFGAMQSAIADDIDDTTNEYYDPTSKAVIAAIRYCERETYYFNETRDETFATVDGQEWYGVGDNAAIATAVRIHELYLEDGNIRRVTLRRASPEELESLADSSASRGEPYAWTWFGQRIRLYPIPGPTVFTIRMQLGPYRLALPMGEDENSAWYDEAFDLIKARAKYILAKDTLKDAALATEALNDYHDQHAALKRETSSRVGRGVIRATCF